MGILSALVERFGKRGAVEIVEQAERIRPPVREIGAGGMPIAQAQPYRNSLRGGSDDLMEAARSRTPESAYPPQAWDDFGSLQGGTPEARLRAQEQGFDTGRVLYHGTRQNVEGAFRPSDVGAFGPGVYLSGDASVASRYAGMGGGEGGNVIPTFTREGRYATPQQFEDAANTAARAGVGKRSLAYERAAQDLASQGYAGVRDGAVTSVFDPRNIRSIFAAFDPAKRDRSDLLAGLALGAPLGGGLLSHAQRRRERARA